MARHTPSCDLCGGCLVVSVRGLLALVLLVGLAGRMGGGTPIRLDIRVVGSASGRHCRLSPSLCVAGGDVALDRWPVLASTCGGLAQCPPAGVRAGIGGRSSRQGERLNVALGGGGSVVGVS